MQTIYLNLLEYVKRQGIGIMALCAMTFAFWTLMQQMKSEMQLQINELSVKLDQANQRFISHLEGDCKRLTETIENCGCDPPARARNKN
jgi:hypothetical protein